jgi:hypothetical protein
MSQQNKDTNRANKKTKSPPADDTVKQKQREKAEVQEVVGRHKNDGQKGYKGRR